MSWQSSPSEKFFINNMRMAKVFIFVFASFLQVTVRAWDVDMTRRQSDLNKFRGPASVEVEKKDQQWLSGLFQTMEPSQELVIMNTEQGFVPSTIRVRKGKTYKVHIVNVNSKEKNTSFVMDSFSEHHGTYFGTPKTFEISPKTEGIFSFLCPETSQQGRLIVVPEAEPSVNRAPASE